MTPCSSCCGLCPHTHWHAILSLRNHLQSQIALDMQYADEVFRNTKVCNLNARCRKVERRDTYIGRWKTHGLVRGLLSVRFATNLGWHATVIMKITYNPWILLWSRTSGRSFLRGALWVRDFKRARQLPGTNLNAVAIWQLRKRDTFPSLFLTPFLPSLRSCDQNSIMDAKRDYKSYICISHTHCNDILTPRFVI